MSHVDDGALHAFLDGALDTLPAAEAERIREHLDSCDACAARLEEERELRREASEILAGAAVPVGELVPLEELRKRAAARRARRPVSFSRMRRLSWAASVIVALGAGWLLRAATAPTVRGDLADRPIRPAVERTRAAQEAAAPPTAEELVLGTLADEATGGRSDGEGSTLMPMAEGQGSPAALTSVDRMQEEAPAPARMEEAREAIVAADLDMDSARVAEAETQTQASGLGIEQALARQKETGMFRLLQDSARRRVATAPAAAKDRLEAEDPLRDDVRSVAAARLDQPSPSEAAVPAAADLDLPASLAVPGLTVLSVTWLDDVPGGVRVRQLLETGDTLELVHLPAGADPSVAGTVTPDGRLELVVQRGGGWLIARAALSRDTLVALLRRMD